MGLFWIAAGNQRVGKGSFDEESKESVMSAWYADKRNIELSWKLKIENWKLTWRKRRHNVECRLTQRGALKKTACKVGDFPTERNKKVSWIFGRKVAVGKMKRAMRCSRNAGFQGSSRLMTVAADWRFRPVEPVSNTARRVLHFYSPPSLLALTEQKKQGNGVTVLSPYRHPLVTTHQVESQCNKRKGDGVTVIMQLPCKLLLLYLPKTARLPAFAFENVFMSFLIYGFRWIVT